MSKWLGSSGGSDREESACNVGDLDSIPGLGRSPEDGNSCPHLYSDLENSLDCIVHGVAKSRSRLSEFHLYFSGGWGISPWPLVQAWKVCITARTLLCPLPLEERDAGAGPMEGTSGESEKSRGGARALETALLGLG